jgi:hypothetical protein
LCRLLGLFRMLRGFSAKLLQLLASLLHRSCRTAQEPLGPPIVRH